VFVSVGRDIAGNWLASSLSDGHLGRFYDSAAKGAYHDHYLHTLCFKKRGVDFFAMNYRENKYDAYRHFLKTSLHYRMKHV